MRTTIAARADRRGTPSLFIPLVATGVATVAVIAVALAWIERDAYSAPSLEAQVEDSTPRYTGAG